jgi:TonB-dependent receptor
MYRTFLSGALVIMAGLGPSIAQDAAETNPAPEAAEPAPVVEPIPDAPVLDESAVRGAVITGEISDSIKLDPVSGVIVEVIGSASRGETDAKGRFTIKDLPPGEHTLEAFKLGYFNEVITITALAGQPVEARIALREKTDAGADGEFELEEEVIVGEYQESSGGDLLLDLDIGSNLAAGLDKEQFSRLGISDAAGAVSKIAGANIVGGKYAVVRGLGDRYSNTLVNGALVPSADPSKKAVQLDLFPSDLLQSVAIIKNATPDLPAEFAGGMVMIQTLRIPEERLIEFELGIETNSNLKGDFYGAPSGSLGFWGNTSDKVPTKSLENGGLSTGHTGSREPLTPEEIALAEQGAAEMAELHGSAGMRPKRRDPKEERSFTFTLGDVYDITPDTRIGGVFSFTHEQGDKIRDVSIGRGVDFGSDFQAGSDGTPGTEDFLIRSQQERRFTEYVNWGSLASFGMEHGEHQKVGFTWFKNNSTEQEVIQGRRIQDVFDEFPEYLPSSSPFGAGAYTYQAFDQIGQLQRELEIMQGDGSHRIGTDDFHVKIDWLISRGEALEDRPQTRTLFFSELDFADPRIASERGDIYQPQKGTVLTAADVYSSNPPLVSSYRESLSTFETAGNERLDLTAPLWDPEEGRKFELKLGLNSFARDREVRGRFFDYKVSPRLNGTLLGDNGSAGSDYLDGFDSPTLPDGTPRFNGWTGPQANSQTDALILTESTLLGRTVRNVDAGNELDAMYMMGSFDFDRWQLRGGWRQEDESRYYQVLPGLNSPAFVNEDRIYQDNDYLLPSFSLSRSFGEADEFRVTAAWFQSVARPTFYEYAPVQIQDQATGDIIVGNPNLVDTEIENFDIEFAWEPSVDTKISLGLFRKEMTSPIAQAFDGLKKTWVNGETGELEGFEVTASQKFDSGWDIGANYTFIDSLLSYTQIINSLGDTQLIDSSFEGQPEHIINLLVGYTYEPWQTRASLVYNYTGSYLTGVPATADSASIMRESYHSLDLVLSKDFQLSHCDGTVKLKLVNLLDSKDSQVFEGTNLPYSSFHPGRGISLSAEFTF